MPRGNIAHIARVCANKKRGKSRRNRWRVYEQVDQTGQGIPLLEYDHQITWGNPLEVPSSVLLPHLNSFERQFFKLVSRGNVAALKTFIQENPALNINCLDYKGQTALVNAIKRNTEEMVDYLLHCHSIILGDAVLYAVQMGNTYIVEQVLNTMRKTGAELSLPGCVVSTEFKPCITPIILAAQCQHYQVVKLLLTKGHFINHPHPPECPCEKCIEWRHEPESLSDTHIRYHSYQAIASPGYICQSSRDPILTAFVLSRELWRWSKFEVELKTEYQQLSKEVSQLAVDLLQQCRTSEEVEQVLAQKTSPPGHRSSVNQPFPTVAFAIECKQKKFLAQPNAQHVLHQAWLGDWQEWRSLTSWWQFIYMLPSFLLLPVIAFIYMIVPKSQYVKTWRAPLCKFINYMVSYLTFLLILCIHNVLDNNTHLRGPPDTGLEWVIILYVTSFIWMHIKICWKQGLRRYIYQNWHRYDLVLLGLFGASFAMWLWSWADVHMYGHKHIPRQYWSQYDPILIAEALYAIATIAAFGKTLYFFQISYELGPLQVSTSKLFKDIFYFFVSYLIALLAFGTGIHKLYNYYRGQVRHDNGEEIKQSGAFITFQATVKNLFWALFGYSPPQWADIVVSEHIYVYNNQTIVLTNKHKFTEAVGYILYGSYSVVTIIILLNLFIALVSTSFMIAKENADEEWKFSRTKVWMVFFEQGSTLPPPFNLVPTVKSVCYKVTWLYQKLTGKYSKFPFQNCCLVKEENISQFTREQYEIVMGHLVQRYMIYATQMQLSQNRLADSDLQYLLHGIPAQHMMAPLLQTSSSDQESEEHCQTVEGEDIEVDLRERCSTSFCEFQTPRASSYDILSPRPPTKGGYLTD